MTHSSKLFKENAFDDASYKEFVELVGSFQTLSDREIDEAILEATEKDERESWIAHVVSMLQGKYRPDSALIHEGQKTAYLKAESTSLANAIKDAISHWELNNALNAKKLPSAPENWAHDVAEHLKKNFIIKFVGIDTSKIEEAINEVTQSLQKRKEKNKSNVDAILKIEFFIQNNIIQYSAIRTIGHKDAKVLSAFLKESRKDTNLPKKIKCLYEIRNAVIDEIDEESSSQTPHAIYGLIYEKPMTILGTFTKKGISLGSGLDSILTKIAVHATKEKSDIAFYENIYNLASKKIDYEEIEATHNLSLIEKKLNRLLALRQIVNNPHWNDKGVGIIGSKTPTHIQKLRKALDEIENAENHPYLNIIIDKIFNEAVNILEDTRKEKSRRDPDVKALYNTWYPITQEYAFKADRKANCIFKLCEFINKQITTDDNIRFFHLPNQFEKLHSLLTKIGGQAKLKSWVDIGFNSRNDIEKVDKTFNTIMQTIDPTQKTTHPLMIKLFDYWQSLLQNAATQQAKFKAQYKF